MEVHSQNYGMVVHGVKQEIKILEEEKQMETEFQLLQYVLVENQIHNTLKNGMEVHGVKFQKLMLVQKYLLPLEPMPKML